MKLLGAETQGMFYDLRRRLPKTNLISLWSFLSKSRHGLRAEVRSYRRRFPETHRSTHHDRSSDSPGALAVFSPAYLVSFPSHSA